MVPMGNTLMKRGTMIDRESKVFAGVQGAVFSKRAPWSPKAKLFQRLCRWGRWCE
jgi:hypothetical protein